MLEAAAETIDGFPDGTDPCFGERWVSVAIYKGSLDAIKWMIGKGVDLRYREDDGSTPIHDCIESSRPEKHVILEMLIKAGADLNAHGMSDWTPLHLAAMRDEHKALRILLEAGADPEERTRIDMCQTAEEEAREFGHRVSADILAMYS